jgi:transglutaminase-like putative cysteine protease
MNRYRLMHITHFSYDAPVTESYNEVRLRPLEDDIQSCLSFRLRTNPAAATANHFDYYGNFVHRFNVLREHQHLRVEADSVVLVQEPPPLPSNGMALDDLRSAEEALDEYYDYLAATAYVPHDASLKELVREAAVQSGGTCAGFARAAMQLVHDRFRYEKGATHVHSSISDTLATGAGVCQDFSHILLAVLRMAGLPGRYVSGYLVPSRAAEPGASVEEVIGGQASHAWVEVFLPGAGWRGLDPTLGRSAGLQHVRIAYGRDYGDAAPMRGVYRGHAGQALSVDVRVRPALDDEGCEHLMETAAGPPEPPTSGPAHQQTQQQQ